MKRWIASVGILVLVGMLASCTQNGRAETPADTVSAELRCRRFVETRLMTAMGGVYTQSKVEGSLFRRPSFDPVQLRESGLLSESNGLLMKYAVAAGDKAMFDRQFAFVRQWMTGHLGLFFWKISADAELTADSTAVVDDLRIVDACLDAFEKWGNTEHRRFAVEVAYNIAQYEAADSRLRDFVNWRDWGDMTLSTQIQLSYLAMNAVRHVARYRDDWQDIVEKNSEILSNGQLDSGLFYDHYDFEKKQYDGTVQNTINQLYSALWLASTEPANKETYKFFKERWTEDGAVYAEYDARTGAATKSFESTGVYAILARYALAMGDRAFAAEIVKKLMTYQISREGDPMDGSFSDDEVYSFDNLEALLTLRLFNETPKPGGDRAN